MLELQDLFIIAILCAFAGYWWKARERKEIALNAAKKHCDTMSVELLDESMVLKSISFVKTPHGRRLLQHRYQFEFSSTGEYRYTGEIKLYGNKVADINLSAHHI